MQCRIWARVQLGPTWKCPKRNALDANGESDALSTGRHFLLFPGPAAELTQGKVILLTSLVGFCQLVHELFVPVNPLLSSAKKNS